ncbi:MAG: hypothetical protein AAFX93_10385 [Verrucomicrobiota bacterium]
MKTKRPFLVRRSTPFDTSRSSFFRHYIAEREAFRAFKATALQTCGEEADDQRVLFTWIRNHQWEWVDQHKTIRCPSD